MGRISSKSKKTMYQVCREELGWSREKASEELGISPERLERIENEKLAIYPEEVIAMSEVYKNPNLCNSFLVHSRVSITLRMVSSKYSLSSTEATPSAIAIWFMV